MNLPFYGEPYFYKFIKKIILKKKYELPFFKPTKISDERYKKHIKNQLNKLYLETSAMDVKLIIAPITSSYNPELNFYHSRAVNMLNEVLKNFSKKTNIIFFDTISILEKGSKNNFIDKCCHLSKKGADIVSSHLSKILINLK